MDEIQEVFEPKLAHINSYICACFDTFSKGAFTSKSEGSRPPKLPMASHSAPALHISLSLMSTLSVPAVGCHHHLKTTRLNLEKSLSFALEFIVTKFWPHIHSIKGYLLNLSGSFPSVYPMTCIVMQTIVTSQMDHCPVLPINSLIALQLSIHTPNTILQKANLKVSLPSLKPFLPLHQT